MKNIKHLKIKLIILSAVLILGACGVFFMCKDKSTDISPYNFAYTVNPDKSTCTVIGIGDCDDSSFTVGGTIDGYRITAIANDAFLDCDNIVSVEIDGSVETIGGYAFYGCDNLESVTLGIGVKDIGEGAFYGCKALKVLDIPDTVRKISDRMLYDCVSLQSVNIPLGVEAIGKFAFGNCYSLENITLPATVGAIDWYAFSGCEGLSGVYISDIDVWYRIKFETPESNPVYYAKKLYLNSNPVTQVMPTGIEEISPYAFYNCESIVSVVIDKDVSRIGQYAFSGCVNLETLTISEGKIKDIDTNAFADCVSLAEITLPYGIKSISDGAFYNCKDAYIYYDGTKEEWAATVLQGNNWGDLPVFFLKAKPSVGLGYEIIEGTDTCIIVNIGTCEDDELVVGDYINGYKVVGIKSLSDFAGYSKVTILQTVTDIGDKAFYKVLSLKDVVMANSVTSMGSMAFSYCDSLESINISNKITYIPENAFYYCTSLKSIDLSSVTFIDVGAFENCDSLETVYLGKGLNEINLGAFSYSEKLKSIIYAGTSDDWNKIKKGNEIFLYCSEDLVLYCTDGEYKIDDEGTILYKNYSDGSYGLEYTVFHDGVTCSITGIGTCTDTDIYIPSKIGEYTVTSIGNFVFSNNPNIVSVTIADGVQEIGIRAFAGCENLTTVSFGTSVSTIGVEAFYNCKSLERIYFDGSTTKWNSIQKGNKCFGLIEDVILICDNNYVVISESGKFVKYDNSTEGLKYVVNKDNKTCTITGIGAATTKHIVIGRHIDGYKVTAIGDGAFNYAGIRSISIEKYVTSIGDYALAGNEIAQLSLSGSINHIGEGFVFECSDLKNIIYDGSADSWQAINKADGWDKGASEFTITVASEYKNVTDGTYNLDYVVNSRDVTCVITGYGQAIADRITVGNYIDGYIIIGISDYAFLNASGKFKTIAIKSNVESIGKGAFYGFENLKIEYSGSSHNWNKIVGNSEDWLYGASNVTVKCSDTTLTFGDTNPPSVTPPESNTYSEGLEFVEDTGDTWLSGIGTCMDSYLKLPSNYEGEAVVGIYGDSFTSNIIITGLEIPEGYTTIGDYAFFNCSKITTVVFPESVNLIEQSAFGHCSKIETITIPGNCIINNNAFASCTSLKTANIQNVTIIGNAGFTTCYNMQSVKLGNSLEKIGIIAFFGCNKLEEVYYDGTREQWEAIEKGERCFTASSTNISPPILICNDGKYNMDENGNIVGIYTDGEI